MIIVNAPAAEQNRQHSPSAEIADVGLALIRQGAPSIHFLLELRDGFRIERQLEFQVTMLEVHGVEDGFEVASQRLMIRRNSPGVHFTHLHSQGDEHVPQVHHGPRRGLTTGPEHPRVSRS